jgi:hypothetical protein
MATEDQSKTLKFVDGYTDEITDELSEDGGTADAQAPKEEISYDVDLGSDIQFEVETEPAPAHTPEPQEYEETVTEEVTEEYTYGPGYGQNYGRGYGQGYGSDYNRGGYFRKRSAARRCNKHIFTWVFSFLLGIYGVDRFARGQIGLGLLKMLTFGGFGFWYLADVVVAALQSYAGTARDQEDLEFDIFGRYI